MMHCEALSALVGWLAFSLQMSAFLVHVEMTSCNPLGNPIQFRYIHPIDTFL